MTFACISGVNFTCSGFPLCALWASSSESLTIPHALSIFMSQGCASCCGLCLEGLPASSSLAKSLQNQHRCYLLLKLSLIDLGHSRVFFWRRTLGSLKNIYRKWNQMGKSNQTFNPIYARSQFTLLKFNSFLILLLNN